MAVIVKTVSVLLLMSCVYASGHGGNRHVPANEEKGSSGSQSPVVSSGAAQGVAQGAAQGAAQGSIGQIVSSPPISSITQGQPSANAGHELSATEFKNYCKKFCKSNPCPTECTQSFLDPWSFKKRSVKYGGLSFDDYLFMKWLGRDTMIRDGFKR